MTKKKRRKLTKVQAKEQALRKKRQQQITWAVAGVATIAVVVVLVLIAMSGEGGGQTEAQPLRDDIETGVTDEGYPYRGSADAPVTILELSDYNCGYCGSFALNTVPLIDDEFVASGQVKYVVQPFALWEESLPIVEAAACARDQGGFWNFHHTAFANQSRFSTNQPPSRGMLRDWAKAGGLDVDEFQACLDEGRHREDVLASTRKGKEEMGVNGTPTFFVNGEQMQLRGDEEYIDTVRKAVQAAASQGQE